MQTLETINEFAHKLAQTPTFSHPEQMYLSENYQIYTAVPVKDIYRGKSLIGTDCSTTDAEIPVLDLVICKGKEIILAVLFDSGKKRSDMLFGLGRILSGMQLVTLPDIEAANANLQMCFQTIATSIQTAEDIAGWSLQCSEFSLHKTSLHKLISQATISKLQACSLVDTNGDITPKGTAYGLFYGITDGCAPKHYIAEHAAKKLFECLFEVFDKPVSNSTSAPLQERLSRIKEDLPTEKRYVQQIVSSLQQLLNMPLTEYYRLSWEEPYPEEKEYDRLQRLMAQASHWLPVSTHAEVSHQTFGDVILLVRTLFEDIKSHTSQHNEIEEVCLGILTALSIPTVADSFNVPSQKTKSLKERLSAINNSCLPPYQVFTLPIKHYIYGACILQQSEYPNWIYHEHLREYMYNPNLDEYEYTPLDLIRNAVELSMALDSASLNEVFDSLYHLLVSPLAIRQNSETSPTCKSC